MGKINSIDDEKIVGVTRTVVTSGFILRRSTMGRIKVLLMPLHLLVRLRGEDAAHIPFYFISGMIPLSFFIAEPVETSTSSSSLGLQRFLRVGGGPTPKLVVCVALAGIGGIGGKDPLEFSPVPCTSRRRFKPRDELSFKPRAFP